MRIARLGAVLVSAAVSVVSGPAMASSLSLGDVLDQFNLVVFDNMTSTSEVEGRTLVGGSLSGASVYFTRGNLGPHAAHAASLAPGSSASPDARTHGLHQFDFGVFGCRKGYYFAR